MIRFIRLTALLFAGAASAQAPQKAVDELLAADRAFSTAGAELDLSKSVAAMLNADAIMLGPVRLVFGKAQIDTMLKANQSTATARASWYPVRGGVSADGTHGFTIGFFTMKRTGSAGTLNMRYVSYWVKGASGWKVSGYRWAGRGEGAIPQRLPPDILPSAMVAPTNDRAQVARHRAALVKAEKAFSDLAESSGLGPAFAQNGHTLAMSMGTPDLVTFLLGNDAVSKSVGQRYPGTESPMRWSADTALVASSGDLGVTFGYIWPTVFKPGATGGPTANPFFTIWWRDKPSAPWKYIVQ
jgi:ketosteroid isomerase-like protein